MSVERGFDGTDALKRQSMSRNEGSDSCKCPPLGFRAPANCHGFPFRFAAVGAEAQVFRKTGTHL